MCCSAVKSLQVTPVRTEYSWPGYGSRYGFTNWPMKKDYMKRQCVKEGYAHRMRLRAIRKSKMFPAELQVNCLNLVFDIDITKILLC